MTDVLHRVLVGGTASGKKTVAAALARRHGLTVLSMDSMKVYRGMDIGTDKPGPALLAAVPFGLLDLVGHDESFSAGRWIEAAGEAVAESRTPVLFAGGTPLYLRLLLRGLFAGPRGDEGLRAELDRLWNESGEAAAREELAAVDPIMEARLLPGDRKRLLRALEVQRLTGRALSDWQAKETRPPIPGRFVVAALRHDAELHAERIARRTRAMLDDGLIDEVRSLLQRAPFAPEPGGSIGYAEAQQHLAGRLDTEALLSRIVQRTRRLVRKQRGFIASHAEVRWVDVPSDADAGVTVDEVARALEL